jgi:hypothetical protein
MINGSVTGFEEIESGTAIPLSLVCKHPSSLVKGRYTLLVDGEPCLVAKTDSLVAAAAQATVEENYQSSAAQLKRFITSFCMKAQLDTEERQALLSRVDAKDPVMVKAFQIAEKKQDVDLLEKYLVMIVECGGSSEGEQYMDAFFTDAWQHLNYGNASEDDEDDDDDADDEDARYALSVPRPGAPSPADDLIRNIEELLRKGVISAQYYQVLRALIEEDNEFILAAFEMYEDDGDEAELVDTLQRVARSRARKASLEMRREASVTSETNDAGQVSPEENDGAGLFPATILYRLAGSFVQEGLVSEADGKVLGTLIETKSPNLRSAWTQFEEDQDRKQLVESILAAIDHSNIDDMDNEEAVLPDQPFVGVMGQFLEMGVLNPQAAERMVEEFEQGNPVVLAAWEVFRLETDHSDFLDTLERVLGTLEPYEDEQTDDDEERGSIGYEGKSDLIAVIENMEEERVLNSEDCVILMGLVQAEHNVMIAAYEAYMADDDLPELMDTLQMIAKFAKEENIAAEEADDGSAGRDANSNVRPFSFETIVAIIQNLHEKPASDPLHVDSEAASALRFLAEKDDEMLMAAMEVFAHDDNLFELVDTLKRLATKLLQQTVDADDQFQDSEPSATAMLSGIAPSDHKAAEELLDLVEQLFLDECISSEEKQVLDDLIGSGNEVVFAAYDVYRDMQDSDDLIDTLWRVARRETMEMDRGGDVSSNTRSRKRALNANDGDLEDGEIREEEKTHLDSINSSILIHTCEMLKILEKGGVFTAVEADVLVRLAEEKDARLYAIFDVYSSMQNLEDLCDSLHKLASVATEEQTRHYDDDVEDDDMEDEVQGGGIEIDASMMQILASMDLTEEQTEVLVDCIQNEDIVMKAAIEVLRIQGDDSDFKDTVARVVHRAMLQREMETPAEPQEEDDFGKMDEDEVAAVANMDDDYEDDFEADAEDEPDYDGDDDNMSEDEQIMLAVAQALIEEASVSTPQAKTLLAMFAAKHEVIMAALKVFKLERDAEDLKDTFRRCALHAQ